MSSTLLKIISSREDISDYLFHFTNKNNAYETLKKIIDSNSIKDIRKTGRICFTETPITLLTNMFEIFNSYYNPMYAPYGIGIKKDYLYSLGARHVIYGSREEKKLLDESIHWRFEEIVPNKKDFSWLREWRINTDEIKLDDKNCLIVTRTKDELEETLFNLSGIIDVEFDGCVADGQYWGSATGIIKRNFKGISLEEVLSFTKLSKEEMNSLLSNQSLDDTSGINLGGFIM